MTPDEVKEMSDDTLIRNYLFNQDEAWSDIYWMFDAIMGVGLKYLFQVTKDITQLKDEINKKFGFESGAMAQSASKTVIEQKMRNELEKAFEKEKNKSVIVKKCSRIYHEFLAGQDI